QSSAGHKMIKPPRSPPWGWKAGGGMRVASIKAIPLRSLAQSGGGGRVKKLETASHGAAAQSNFRKHDASELHDKIVSFADLIPPPIAPGKNAAILAQPQFISTQMPDDFDPPLGKHGGVRPGAGRPRKGEIRERKIQRDDVGDRVTSSSRGNSRGNSHAYV